MFDLKQHLLRQMAHSHATFGPGRRTKGIIDHIRKELIEVENCKNSSDRQMEWVDVAILALDGLTRDMAFELGDRYDNKYDPELVAEEAISLVLEKQGKNESREWPNWRDMDPDKAIEHDRTKGIQ